MNNINGVTSDVSRLTNTAMGITDSAISTVNRITSQVSNTANNAYSAVNGILGNVKDSIYDKKMKSKSFAENVISKVMDIFKRN